MRLGEVDYITKPFDEDVLLALIRTTLGSPASELERIGEVEEVLAELVFSELVRRSAEVGSELVDGADVGPPGSAGRTPGAARLPTPQRRSQNEHGAYLAPRSRFNCRCGGAHSMLWPNTTKEATALTMWHWSGSAAAMGSCGVPNSRLGGRLQPLDAGVSRRCRYGI